MDATNILLTKQLWINGLGKKAKLKDGVISVSSYGLENKFFIEDLKNATINKKSITCVDSFGEIITIQYT